MKRDGENLLPICQLFFFGAWCGGEKGNGEGEREVRVVDIAGEKVPDSSILSLTTGQ